jgi:hypothetical protein
MFSRHRLFEIRGDGVRTMSATPKKWRRIREQREAPHRKPREQQLTKEPGLRLLKVD